MNEICDQINCLLHLNYIEEKIEPQKITQTRAPSHTHTYQGMQNSAPSSWTQATMNATVSWNAAVDYSSGNFLTKAFEVPKDSGNKSIMLINLSKELRVPIECLFCVHMKKLDMEKEVWAMRAKNKLLEK
jgi:hypothetical protein